MMCESYDCKHNEDGYCPFGTHSIGEEGVCNDYYVPIIPKERGEQ